MILHDDIDNSKQLLHDPINVENGVAKSEEEEPYHTPKNIFIPPVARVSRDMSSSVHIHKMDETIRCCSEENPYSTIRTMPIRANEISNNSSPSCYTPLHSSNEVTEDSMVHRPFKDCLGAIVLRIRRQIPSHVDTCDYLLAFGVVFTSALFIFGVCLLFLDDKQK